MTAHQWYALFLMQEARFGEALPELARAQEIDPLSLVTHCSVATAYFFARDYDRARGWLDRAEDLDRNYFMTYLRRGQIHLAYQHSDLAIRDLQNAVVLSDRRAAYDNIRYCDFAVGVLERAVGQQFGSNGKTEKERDDAVTRALAWLKSHGVSDF